MDTSIGTQSYFSDSKVLSLAVSTPTTTMEAFDFSTRSSEMSNFSEEDMTSAVTFPPPLFDPGYILKSDLYRVYEIITFNKYYFLVPMAVVVNVFCVAVLWPKMRQNTAYMLMGHIAIWDMLVIVFRGFLIWARVIDLGDVGCSIVSFLADFVPAIAIWLVVLLTADRCVAVWFPLKHKELCSYKRILMAYCGIVFISIIIVSDHLFAIQTAKSPDGFYCVFKIKYRLITRKFRWAYSTWYSYIPAALMVILNGFLVYIVRRQAALFAGAKQTVQMAGTGNIERHVTRMAILVSIAFIVLFIPYVCFNIALIIWNYLESNDTFFTYLKGLVILHLSSDLNHIINPFLYLFSGRRFRKDAKMLISKLICCTGMYNKDSIGNSSEIATSVSQVH